MLYVYKLRCGDKSQVIIGPHALDIEMEVQKVLNRLTDKEILATDDDWFPSFVSYICRMNSSFQVLRNTGEVNVKMMYWDERSQRIHTEDNNGGK